METGAYTEWKKIYQSGTTPSSDNKHFEKMQMLLNKYQQSAGQGQTNLHALRTLDQFYHMVLEVSPIRDDDQVVSRFTRDRTKIWPTKASFSSQQAQGRLLVVNQLWLWKFQSACVAKQQQVPLLKRIRCYYYSVS
jgi:hypothetical protein